MVRPSLRASSALASILIALPAFPPPALADWRTEPVQLQSYASPQVAACEDVDLGAIVVWEDHLTSSSGPLRSSHLLANGALDPGWANAGIVWGQDLGRSLLRAFADGAGGTLVTWMEGASLRLLHVGPDGRAPWIAPIVTTVPSSSRPPRVLSDGQGGLYVAWLVFNPNAFHVLHVDDEGRPFPGWPEQGKIFHFLAETGNDNLGIVCGGSIGLAPDGGVWVAYLGYAVAPGGMIQPGTVRLTRLTSNGSAVAGWVRDVASFPAETMPCPALFGSQGWEFPMADLLDVCSDEEGGAYVVRAEGVVADPLSQPDQITFLPKVHHYDAMGATAAGWPEEGLSLGGPYADPYYSEFGPSGSYRVWSLAGNEVGVGLGESGGTSLPSYRTYRLEPDGSCGLAFGGGIMSGIEFARSPAGVVYVASFYPDGPRGPCDWSGYTECSGSDGAAYWRTAGEGQYAHYSDVGVAALADGGAIFVWGENGTEMNGLFAIRLGGAPSLDVPASAATPARTLSLRFSPGAGIRASLALAGAGETHVLLADVTGRAVARETFALESGAREWTIGGTDALAPGLYFARVTRGAETVTAHVVVTR